MTRTIIETDWNNDFLTSGQCWSTARDFGRFGMLYLADGMWNGERILPAGWAKYVSTPAPAQPAARQRRRALRRRSSGSMAARTACRPTPTRPAARSASTR